MAFFIFVLLPLSELLTYIIVGQIIGSERAFALAILTMIAGIFLFRFRRSGRGGGVPFGSAKDVPAPADSFLYSLGAILLIIPGFLTDLLGLFLVIPPGRNIFYKTCLCYCQKNQNTIPLFFKILPMFFGIDMFGAPGTQSSESSRSFFRWRRSGAQTSENTFYSDNQNNFGSDDVQPPYDGDISRSAKEGTDIDDEIIDVDYTVR